MTNVGRDAEADVLQVGLDLLQPFLDEQRAHLERRRPARLQVLAEVREREAGVDDVLDDQHVAVGEVEIEVLHDAHDTARARRRPVRRHRHEVELDGQVDRAGEIGHEHERALEDADEQRRMVVVVGGDLLAEIADALLQLVLVDDDPTDVRVVHVVSGLRAQPEETPGTGRDPDAMVDTVTDDPHGLGRRDHRARAHGGSRRRPLRPARRAAASSRCGRAGGTARPARARPDHAPTRARDRRRTPPARGRRATPPGARARSRPRSRSPPKRARPGSASVTGARRASAALGTATRTSRPRTRSTRSPPGSSRGAHVAARDREHTLDGRERRRRGRGEPARGSRAAPARAGNATQRRGVVGRRAAAASSSSSSSSSRRSSAWRASTSTRSRSAPPSSAGMISRRSHTRRWCRSSFIGSCTGARPQARAQLVRLARAARSSSGRRTYPRARRHAREPGRRRAPQHLQQHGLGLVVARVRRRGSPPRRPRARTRSSAA